MAANDTNCLSLTDWLTHSCLVNLIDVTLVCEDANSKLVEVVTVADVDDEKHVDDGWQFVADLEGEVLVIKYFLSRLGAQGLVKISKLKFKQDFEVEFLVGWGYEAQSWSIFWS